MIRPFRPRRLATSVAMLLAVVALAACSGNEAQYPNSTFEHSTEFNTAIDLLWDRLLFWATVVFVIVEVILVYTIVKFRRRPGQAEPKHVHGNTALEITWTVVPAVILVFIAIPTVRTIFSTQAAARPDALQVEVIGHQWWWEFRYPQLGIVTANELYLPKGKTVNFALKTKDVLHSFWIPRLGGKRDLISNRTNYLWFTVDSTFGEYMVNGQCAEYCGDSHANMKFRAIVVDQGEFDAWAAHQKGPAVFGAAPAAPAAGTTGAAPTATPVLAQAGDSGAALAQAAAAAPAAPGWQPARDKVKPFAIPTSRIPRAMAGKEIPADVLAAGDARRGQQIYSSNSCIGCHAIAGNPMSVGIVGPNLTHVGSRVTLGAGIYPNDAKHLALWIKNTRHMKPGSIMPTLGVNEYDPILKKTVTTGGLSDQQIADIVAYLQALK